MRRLIVLFLALGLILSLSACASKSEYDKLLDQNKALELKHKDAIAQQDQLKQVIAAREMEIKDLKGQLKTVNSKVSEMQSQLTKTEAELKAVKK